jgi:hypothetical protein
VVSPRAARGALAPALFIVPIDLDEANALVGRWHRHHQPVLGHRFSIGIADGAGELHGAVIGGRPVARRTDLRRIAEVTRLVTDGTKNACSMLYAAAARCAKAQGFERIQTFILDSETGVSLRAAGWTYDGPSSGGSWFREANPSHSSPVDRHPTTPKGRWSKPLNPPRPVIVLETADESQPTLGLDVGA